VGLLTFEAPDEDRFPALRIARDALEAGGGAPAAMNAANEIAVQAFLGGRLGFLDISSVVAATLDQLNDAGDLGTGDDEATVDWAMAIDASARRLAAKVLSRFERMG
jgi:1-deoxy-D-xylulose-5-phosphate reductoisomerase